MRLKDVIRAKKEGVRLGKWTTGHIPKSQLPLAKAPSRAYRFGPTYEWRIISFVAGGLECKVLVLINEAREKYRAMLAVAVEGGFVPVCDHEFSTEQEPWHCHSTSGELEDIAPGRRRGHMRRWPNGGSRKYRKFISSKDDGLARALKVFRIEEEGSLI